MKQTAVSRETTMRIDTLHYGDGTVPPGNEGLPNVLAKSMSQVDSRHNGCVVIGALPARSCRDSILAAFEMSLAAQSQFGNSCRPISQRRSKPRRGPSRPKGSRRGNSTGVALPGAPLWSVWED